MLVETAGFGNSSFAESSRGQITVESSQSRVFLPNASAICLESRKSVYTSVQLILSSRGIESIADKRGYRHLLEHLVARSLPGHDEKIEGAGGLLTAYTDRDWIRFEWKVPAGKEKLAYEGLEAFLKPKTFTAEQIKKESRIIYLEGLETSILERNIEKDWLTFYGSDGIAPLGDANELEKVEPEELAMMWKALTSGPQVTISISGNIDLKQESNTIKKIAQQCSIGKDKPWKLRQLSDNITAGSGRSIYTNSVDSKRTMSALIAAFGVGAKLKDTAIHYQPTFRGGLISLVGEGKVAKIVADEGEKVIFDLGKRYVRGWIDFKTSNASESAAFHGILMSLDRSFSPKKLKENIDLAPVSDFRAELTALGGQL